MELPHGLALVCCANNCWSEAQPYFTDVMQSLHKHHAAKGVFRHAVECHMGLRLASDLMSQAWPRAACLTA